MNGPETIRPEALKRFQQHFLLALRQNQSLDIFTGDRLFDIRKLFALYREAGLDYVHFDVTERADAAAETRSLGTQHRLSPPQPAENGHYLFKRSTPITRYPIQAYLLENTYFSYDVSNNGFPSFYFFNERKELINGLFFGGQPFLEECHQTFEQPVSFADDFFVSFNICHLIFDKYPRAFIANKAWKAEEALLFYTNAYTDMLGRLNGLQFLPLANERRRGTVFLKRCVCFSNAFTRLGHPAESGNTEHVEALETLRRNARLLPAAGAGPERYFIIRPPERVRKITNIAEVSAVLLRSGYTLGDPAELSPERQMAVFAGVKSLAGVHGAGLANLAFMPDGASVIELLPPLCASNAYWDACAFLDRKYLPVICFDPELGDVAADQSQHNVAMNRRDVTVPIERLEAAIQAEEAAI